MAKVKLHINVENIWYLECTLDNSTECIKTAFTMSHLGDYKFPCITVVLAVLWLKTCNKMCDKAACVGVKVCKSMWK
jgi:hypothetical protein